MKQFVKQFHRGMILTLLVTLLLCVCLLMGCTDTVATVDIEPKETVPANSEPTKTEFTKEELLADYDDLWEVLEEEYLYFPLLERQGVNIASLKISTRQQLEDRITDFNGFYYLLNNMFGKMQFY